MRPKDEKGWGPTFRSLELMLAASSKNPLPRKNENSPLRHYILRNLSHVSREVSNTVIIGVLKGFHDLFHGDNEGSVP